MGEPNAPGVVAHRYVLMVSDGEETARKHAPPREINAHVLIVNGAARQGIVARYNPTRFDGLGAAIEFVTAREVSTSSAAKE